MRQAQRGNARTKAAAAEAAPPASLPELPPFDGEFESRHAFAPQANWLIPGHLLVGRYPFVEPSRCSSRTEGEELLARILRSGITAFVSLNGELPPQGEMAARGANGFLPYKATADLLAASMSGLPPAEVVEGLRNPQLDKYIPERRREASASYRDYKPLQPQYLHLPITDMEVPQREQLQNWVADLASRLQSGEKIYMHCWGGRGRAGTVGACLLARMYGLSADEALQRVQRGYDCRNFDDAKSPETDEQLQLVRDFAAGV